MITLYPNEHILIEKRRFWLPIVLKGIVIFIVALIPLIMTLVLKAFLPSPLQEFVKIYQLPALFFSIVWALLAWIGFFIQWTDYFLDVFLITDKRIIDIEQIGLFSRDTSETRLENIQDMRVEISGFLASTMDFGNLYIQTAGNKDEFIISNVGNPTKIKDMISHQCECLAVEKASSTPASPGTPAAS